MEKLKIGIFGAGRGVDLAHSFLALGCDVVAVCDFNSNRLAQGIKDLGTGVVAYENFDEVINSTRQLEALIY